jgi:hypothetical protein
MSPIIYLTRIWYSRTPEALNAPIMNAVPRPFDVAVVLLKFMLIEEQASVEKILSYGSIERFSFWYIE